MVIEGWWCSEEVLSVNQNGLQTYGVWFAKVNRKKAYQSKSNIWNGVKNVAISRDVYEHDITRLKEEYRER